MITKTSGLVQVCRKCQNRKIVIGRHDLTLEIESATFALFFLLRTFFQRSRTRCNRVMRQKLILFLEYRSEENLQKLFITLCITLVQPIDSRPRPKVLTPRENNLEISVPSYFPFPPIINYCFSLPKLLKFFLVNQQHDLYFYEERLNSVS